MLLIEPLKPCWKQLPCKKKKNIHYVHHNMTISDTKAHFVYPVSFRWAATCWESNWSELKCPGATRQKSELFFNQSINEKQGVKCWVTKKNEGHLCSGRQQHNRDDLISMARLYMLHQFPCPLTRGSVGNWLYNKDFPFRSCVSMKMKQSSNPRWCRYTQQVC